MVLAIILCEPPAALHIPGSVAVTLSGADTTRTIVSRITTHASDLREELVARRSLLTRTNVVWMMANVLTIAAVSRLLYVALEPL